MQTQVAYSTAGTAREVANELRRGLTGPAPQLVLYFASSRYDPEQIARAMKDAFPGVPQIGCTTAGEIVSGRMMNDATVAMAFPADVLRRVSVAVIEDVRDPLSVDAALSQLEAESGEPLAGLDTSRFIGLVLADGLSGGEEQLMDTLGNRTDVFFVGGSAGDDLRFERTHVFANGRALSGAAVLALLEPAVEFTLLKTQSFHALPQTLVATKVDEAHRTVLEFNDRPAAVAYADALGVTVEQLPKRFMKNPLGVMALGEPYVRSPQRLEGNAVVFYCQINAGDELSVLESGDIVLTTADALMRKAGDFQGVTGIVNFNCILRTLELNDTGASVAYGKLFERAPTIGFSTYGEAYLGHINQTATMLVLKDQAR